MTPLRMSSAVAWLPWSAAAFARARDEDKCILLSLTAAWSAACRDMDERCYNDPSIAAEINRWFIPVRVEADRRPDIAERYELGGLPTTAFLDGEGRLLGGGTFVPPDRLMEVLKRARTSRAPSAGGADIDVTTPVRGVTPTVDELTGVAFASFDPVHGGFGDAPKFPLIAAVRLALHLSLESDAGETSAYVTRTLDAMGWNGLYDEEEGGFFRCAEHADWSGAHPEKLLSVNAALLDLYLEAGVALGNERWLARAADTVAFVQRALALAPETGWRASTASDATRFTDVNAEMVSAALRAARAFEDDQLREIALHTLESVLLATYRPGRGIAHYEGGVRVLLADHVAMIAAHLDAWDVTQDVVYQMMAQELGHFVVRTMLRPDGSFADRASVDGDELHGLLAYPLVPFVTNCEAASVLHRLGRVTGEPDWHQHASGALDAVAPLAAAQGPLAAHFVLARRALTR